ncbi:hypothetical protein BGX38DRAFT_1334041 [Terfezia claveryi]|nr:hypothetical protein BGX38DRAFT_1334041 [Terfezia claveryi]
MALIAAGGSRAYYPFISSSYRPKTAEADTHRHPRVEPSTAMPNPSAHPATRRTRVTAASGAPSTPPHSDHSDSDPLLANALPASYKVLTPTTTPIKTTGLQHPSTPCLALRPRCLAPQTSLPMRLFPPPHPKPQPPQSILDLTPDLLRRLAYDSCSAHTIPCTLAEFLSWHHQYFNVLESESDKTISRLWEYSERNESFIIRCMPTPVHESFCRYAAWFIPDAVQNYTKLNPLQSGISVHTNTDIKGLGPQRFSHRCPDLCIRVKSARPNMFIRGIVVEVGFSQSLASLRQKALDWFEDISELHMCILIDIAEQAQERMDSTGKKISKSKAKKLKNEWPDWLMGNNDNDHNAGDGSHEPGGALILEEEIIRRMEGRMVETKTEGQQVLMGVTDDLKTWLLEQDQQGLLISALVEPMDATIYVYARAGNDEGGKLDGDGRGGGGVAAQASASDAGCRTGEEYPAGNADNLNDSSTSSDNSFDPAKTCSDSERENTNFPISLIFSAPFVASSKPIPPSPHGQTHLAFTIAELYGPLPQPTPSRMNNNPPSTISTIPPSLLELIPPMIRPHAHNTIAIPLDALAQLVIDAGEELREERAMSRAVKMVEREWAKVWEAVIKAREVKQRGKRKNERAERLVERRKRQLLGHRGGVSACSLRHSGWWLVRGSGKVEFSRGYYLLNGY